MKVVQWFAIGCVLALQLPAIAADFEVVDSAEGFNLKVTGEIRAGDADRLIAIIRARNEVPVISRIATTGGDLNEAMRLGKLYRTANLSVMTGESCDTSCFLWLVGGVSRAVTGNLSLNRAWLSQPTVSDYLLQMDAPEEVISLLLEPSSQNTIEYSQAEFDQAIGERPASFASRLEEHCGVMSEKQQEDLRLAQSMGFLDVLLQMRAADPGRTNLDVIIEKYQKMAERAADLSDAYKQSLSQLWIDIHNCRLGVVRAGQQQFLANLLSDASSGKGQ